MTQQSLKPKTIQDVPTYWFAELQKAREDGNSVNLSRAQSELNRLGYDVRVTA